MLKIELEQAAIACCKRAEDIFDVSLGNVAISWFARGNTIGWARTNYSLRFNEAAFIAKPEHMLREIVPHEVAHLVVFAMQRSYHHVIGGPHGKTWKIVCAALGGNPSRTTDAYKDVDLRARKTRQWLYRVNSGREIWVSTKMHNSIQHGRNRWFRDTKEGITRDHCTFQQRLAA